MPVACVDTNVWFYALARPAAGEAGKHLAARGLIETLVRPTVTPQILNELGFNLRRKRAWSESDLRTLLVELRGRCQLFTPGPDWPEAASELRERHGLSYWDGLVVASALAAGCDTLYSEDMQHGQAIGGLTVVDPFRV